MNQPPKSTPVIAPFSPPQAYLAIELKPLDASQKRCLQALGRHVLAHTHTTDLRALAGAVKKLLERVRGRLRQRAHLDKAGRRHGAPGHRGRPADDRLPGLV